MPRRVGLAAALAFGAGVIVTIEFSAAALLPDLASGLGRSLADAGRLVSVFALASCLLGPPLTAALGGRPAGAALAGLLAGFGALNILAAAAPSYWGVFWARVVQGAALPAFISLAIAVLVAADDRPQGRALAGLNVGVALGAVAALPAAVAFTGQLDWRATFVALGLLCLLAAGGVLIVSPRAPLPTADLAAEAGLLRRPAILANLALSALVFTALFFAYSYLTAYLREAAGLGAGGAALALAGFAAAGLTGNAAAGRLVDGRPMQATIAVMGVFALAVILAGASGGRVAVLAAPLAGWGAAHAAAFLVCQSRLLQVAPEAPAFASALNISAANLGIAMGAAAGGAAVERYGVGASLWGGALLGIAAAAVAAAMPRPRLRRSP